MSKKELRKKDIEFYLELWENSNKKCQVSGKFLGKDPLTTFFHHILPKSRFPQYRWCKWNILIVDPEIHMQIELDLDRVPKARQFYDDLLRLHENGELSKC